MTASASAMVAGGADIAAISTALRALQPHRQRQAVAPVAHRHLVCF